MRSNKLKPVGVVAVFALLLASAAGASSVHWDDGPDGALSVAAGKAASWAAMRDGALLFKESRRGDAPWQRCGGLDGFRAHSVAARANDALVASDNGRVALMQASDSGQGLRCNKLADLGEVKNAAGKRVLVRDVGFGLAMYVLGEDGELYIHRSGRWERDEPLNGSRPSAVLNTIHTETRSNANGPGRVICELPGTDRSFVLTDRKHRKALVGGLADATAGHDWANYDGNQPYGNTVVWHFERVEAQCLYRLRVHGGGYLRAADGNRVDTKGGKSSADAFWRLISAPDGAVRIVNYRTGTTLGAGNNYDGNVYHATFVGAQTAPRHPEQLWQLAYAPPRSGPGTDWVTDRAACGAQLRTVAQRGTHVMLVDAKHFKAVRWEGQTHGDGKDEQGALWKLKIVDPQQCIVELTSLNNSKLLNAGRQYDGKIHIQSTNNRGQWSRWKLRFVLHQRIGTMFELVNMQTNRQLVAGDNYNGQLYNQEANGRRNARWRIKYLPVGQAPISVAMTGDGKYFSRGVQAMRVSSDHKHRRLWFAGTNDRVASFIAGEGSSGKSVNGKWVGVQQAAVDFHNDGSGRTWWVAPSGELFQAQGSNDGGRTWAGQSQVGSGLAHLAVSSLGYPVAIRSNGVLTASSPGRDNSVPNAASCSARDPFSWVSNYAQAHYGKLKSDVTGLANAVASGDYKSALSRLAAMQAQYPSGPFTPDIMGDLLGATGVSELQAIHAAVQQSRLAGNQAWANAVAGDIDVATKHNAGLALYHLGRGDAAAAAKIYTENPYVKYYILGPIREIDWSRPSALILAELQAKYYQRALKAKSELLKYTPAGAAQYSINAGFKNALAAHGPGFVTDPLGLNLPPNSRQAKAANNMIAAALIEMGEDFEPPAEPPGPSGLYAQAIATPVTAREVWNDSGSGGDNDGAFYSPVVGRNNDDCISLGDYMQRGGTRPPKQLVQLCNVRQGKGIWWDRPVDYDFIWSDRCSGANSDGSVWLPVCPTGFAPLGFVTNDTADVKPWLDRVACLRRSSKTLDFAKSNSLKWAWNDRGSGATFNVEVMNRYFGPIPLMVAYPAYRDTNQVRAQEYFFDPVQSIRSQGVSRNFDF